MTLAIRTTAVSSETLPVGVWASKPKLLTLSR
jgi:hypothetical protein